MTGETLAVALGSATAMASAAVGLIFLRHWSRTRDRLFAYFAGSFGLMAVNRIALMAAGEAHEATTLIYLVRLAAFVLIIAGIVEKNLATRTTGGKGP